MADGNVIIPTIPQFVGISKYKNYHWKGVTPGSEKSV